MIPALAIDPELVVDHLLSHPALIVSEMTRSTEV